MDASKKSQQFLKKIIVLGLLFVFPFGQLLRLKLNFNDQVLTLLAVDLFAGLSLLFLLFQKKSAVSKWFTNIFLVCIFSLIFSFSIFKPLTVLIGFFYLLRVFAYYSFFILVWNLIRTDPKFKEIVFGILLICLVFTAILGWVQYFWFFDLTSLKYFGWDDHLGRLVGTFLDPGFTGIILVFGVLAFFLKYIFQKRRVFLLISGFFLLSIIFTYSRASYLAVLGGLLVIAYLKKNIKPAFLLITIFILMLPFLPRPKSEGVRLERTSSVFARIINYKDSFQIFQKSPLFGVGFNNICAFKVQTLNYDQKSHSCGGLDSSLLLVLATTGIVGFLIIMNSLMNIYAFFSPDYFGVLAKAFFVALLIHSLFVNSYFYPWVMGVNSVLLSLSVKD